MGIHSPNSVYTGGVLAVLLMAYEGYARQLPRLRDALSYWHLVLLFTAFGDSHLRHSAAKWSVASSNINTYHRKSTFSGPDGSSGQLATRHASSQPRIWKSGNLGIWKSRNLGILNPT